MGCWTVVKTAVGTRPCCQTDLGPQDRLPRLLSNFLEYRWTAFPADGKEAGRLRLLDFHRDESPLRTRWSTSIIDLCGSGTALLSKNDPTLFLAPARIGSVVHKFVAHKEFCRGTLM
jgi:hypothetical protein